MQVSKILVALTVAAGFASVSFAQGIAPLAAPATKVAAPAPAASEKKVDALKTAEPAKSEAPKSDSAKPGEKHAKVKAHEHKGDKHEAAEAKPAATPAPTTK